MDCAQTRHLMDAYLDGELDLINNLEIEAHMHGCSACSIIYRNRQILREGLKQDAIYFHASPELERRIRRSLHTPPRYNAARWGLIAAALIVMVVAVVAVLKAMTTPQNEGLAAEVLSSHVRSLMANHLADIPSTDQHTVKPWFDGKLDFSPPVVDLADAGFPLIGGRLDYLANRPVAALVYRRHGHIINLFIWPLAGTPAADYSTSQQGYEVIHWTKDGMTFWAISDVSPADLSAFVALLQSAPPPSENTAQPTRAGNTGP